MDEIFTSIGIGFGPSNIALAIALRDLSGHFDAAKRHLFLDRRPHFSWHPGLLFPESTMQISFLKDLVSTADPKSEFTFLNFLHEKGRLHQFINLRTFYPRRVEFNEYLQWAADKLQDFARFKTEVRSVSLALPDNPAASPIVVETVDSAGRSAFRKTRNLILADGGSPKLPVGLTPTKRLFHGSSTLKHLEELEVVDTPNTVFHIIGSGQSAADIFAYLSAEFPSSQIKMTHRSFAMRPEDDSHFVNELFMPSGVELFEKLPQEWRDKVVKDYWHVTHNGVTIDMLPKLYEAVYYDRTSGTNRFSFNPFSELTEAEELNGRVVAKIRDLPSGRVSEVRSDVLIMATGYDRPCPHPLLEQIQPLLKTTDDGRSYLLDGDYKVQSSSGPLGFNVFLQGYAERTHGFSEALLSLVPVRAQRIAKAVMQ
ncbi:SidA/IucD/PvdA family monooxygenase [Agrobacterium fabrum]|uniref:SidA/IucD/PvdA family monooxygenase n=1 Tax=Agrobacterium fabrum TaxID=1176649 RepID=UPI00273F07A2|nr:SidA/IucD/PvdA family monooxygenase [Agrobacterium fabrum]WLP57473.1 SidA/IucD/PvdA family monooxygenase [Agrobacterium fabrum]